MTGTFTAITTLDGIGRERSGQRFVDANPVDCKGRNGETLWEILFPDGEWMLADVIELEPRP